MQTPRSPVSGFTLVESIVALLISSLVLTALVNEFSKTAGWAYDQKIRESTYLQAQAILQTMGAEIRSIGNGVPFEQANCEIGESTLSDVTVTYPVIIGTASTTNLPFRANEYGNIYVLTSSFDPAASSTFTVSDVSTVAVGDKLYLNNSTLAGNDCMYGTVSALVRATKTITVTGKVYSPSATFGIGTMLQEVPTITYANSGSGITRDNGTGAISLGPGSSFVATYLTADNTTIVPPLTEDGLVDNLRQINLAVTVVSTKRLRVGGNFTATVNQTFAIRNFNYVY